MVNSYLEVEYEVWYFKMFAYIRNRSLHASIHLSHLAEIQTHDLPTSFDLLLPIYSAVEIVHDLFLIGSQNSGGLWVNSLELTELPKKTPDL